MIRLWSYSERWSHIRVLSLVQFWEQVIKQTDGHNDLHAVGWSQIWMPVHIDIGAVEVVLKRLCIALQAKNKIMVRSKTA